MRVSVIHNEFKNCPAAIGALGSPGTRTYISIGKEYEVYALSVYRGLISLQIVNDLDIVVWLPSWFFSVIDSTVPHDWICTLPNEDVQLLLGPDFIAADEPSYVRMVEMEPQPVAAFWRRVDAKAKEDDE